MAPGCDFEKRRPKGSGSILKIKSGTYYLEYTINGKTKNISLRAKSHKDAKQKAKEYFPILTAKSKEQIAVHVNEARKLAKRGKVRLDDAWSLYLKNPARPDSSEGTLGNYERMWKKLKKWLSSHYPDISSLGQVSENICQEYAKYLWKKDKDGNGLSANTYNYHIQALRLVCRILKNEAGFDINPFESITKKSENKQSRRELTEDQVLNVLAYFDNKNFYLLHKNEMKVMFNLGAWTGLRLSDCALMQWSNIDFSRNLISCIPQKTRHKTNKAVTIPIHPNLQQELIKAEKWKKNEYVLPKIAARYHQNSNGVKKDAVKVFDKAGFNTTQEIEGVQRKRKANIYGFHSFRHSFVSFCAKAGVPLPVVQSIVGHGNPAITRHYIHVGEESVKQAINALPTGEENKKSPEKKIEEIKKLLKSKKKLSKFDKEIMEIIENS